MLNSVCSNDFTHLDQEMVGRALESSSEESVESWDAIN